MINGSCEKLETFLEKEADLVLEREEACTRPFFMELFELQQMLEMTIVWVYTKWYFVVLSLHQS